MKGVVGEPEDFIGERMWPRGVRVMPTGAAAAAASRCAGGARGGFGLAAAIVLRLGSHGFLGEGGGTGGSIARGMLGGQEGQQGRKEKCAGKGFPVSESGSVLPVFFFSAGGIQMNMVVGRRRTGRIQSTVHIGPVFPFHMKLPFSWCFLTSRTPYSSC